MDGSTGRAAQTALLHGDDPVDAMNGVLARLLSGEATGFIGVELLRGKGFIVHVHGSACDDRVRALGCIAVLEHGVQHIDG